MLPQVPLQEDLVELGTQYIPSQVLSTHLVQFTHPDPSTLLDQSILQALSTLLDQFIPQALSILPDQSTQIPSILREDS